MPIPGSDMPAVLRGVAVALLAALPLGAAWAQTSPARGPLAPSPAAADDIPLADYLALLGQIAPAAEAGARAYLAAVARRCGRPLRVEELRRALAQGDGDPALMGLIRAHHLQDAAAQAHWSAQVPCPRGDPR